MYDPTVSLTRAVGRLVHKRPRHFFFQGDVVTPNVVGGRPLSKAKPDFGYCSSRAAGPGPWNEFTAVGDAKPTCARQQLAEASRLHVTRANFARLMATLAMWMPSVSVAQRLSFTALTQVSHNLSVCAQAQTD